MPKFISPSGRNLLEGLLCADYKKRIGFQGAFQIKQHDFFQDIDWEAAYRKELKPIIPEPKPTVHTVIPEDSMPTGNYQRDLDGWSVIIK